MANLNEAYNNILQPTMVNQGTQTEQPFMTQPVDRVVELFNHLQLQIISLQKQVDEITRKRDEKAEHNRKLFADLELEHIELIEIEDLSCPKCDTPIVKKVDGKVVCWNCS